MTAKMTSRPPIKSKRVSWTFRNAIEKTVAANGSNASIRLAVVGKMSLRLRANIKNGATVPNRMMTSSKPNWNHVSVRWTRHIGCSAVRKTPAISSPQPVTVNAPYFGSSVRGIKVLVATPIAESPPQKSTTGEMARLFKWPCVTISTVPIKAINIPSPSTRLGRTCLNKK